MRMLNLTQFRQLIIKSTLNDLLMYSENAEELLVFTCAVESNGGSYLAQLNGPALGIYQMEPTTYTDIWQNYLQNKHRLLLIMLSNFDSGFMPSPERLIYDLRFATAMARIHYDRVQAPLPNSSDQDTLWDYYKKYYNTSHGAADKDAALKKYHDFLAG